jgi:valyl-tRNA synthetase
MARELPKTYEPKEVEAKLYKFWNDGGYFHTKADP